MLLPPTDTPLTGIDFTRRLPCGENERVRKAMRVFFALRMLSLQLSSSEERDLPLTMPSNSATVGDIVDLSKYREGYTHTLDYMLLCTLTYTHTRTHTLHILENCDLVACSVTVGEKTSNRFMVVTETEFLLVDPDKTKLGWGVINFIAFLQVTMVIVEIIIDPVAVWHNILCYFVLDLSHRQFTYWSVCVCVYKEVDVHVGVCFPCTVHVLVVIGTAI